MIKEKSINSNMMLPVNQTMIDYKKVLRTRVIEFDREFTRDYCISVANAIGKMIEYDKLIKTPKNKLKLRINVYSYGGDVDALYIVLSKLDRLKELGYEVITHNASVAMSCGFVLSVYGTIKTCSPYATYMNHQVSAGTIGTYAEMETRMGWIKEAEDRLNEIIKRCTNLSNTELNKPYRTNRDVFYNAEEAIKKGIADKIVID